MTLRIVDYIEIGDSSSVLDPKIGIIHPYYCALLVIDLHVFTFPKNDRCPCFYPRGEPCQVQVALSEHRQAGILMVRRNQRTDNAE